MPRRIGQQPPARRRGGLLRGAPSLAERAEQRQAALSALRGREVTLPAQRPEPLAGMAQGIAEGLQGMGPAVQRLNENLVELQGNLAAARNGQQVARQLGGNYWLDTGATTTGNIFTNASITMQTGSSITYTLNAGGYVTYTPQSLAADTPRGMPIWGAEPRETVRPSEEELARWERERDQRVQHLRAVEEQRGERTRLAEERARDLMRAVLTDAQWEEFERDNRVTVRGSAGGLYRVVCNGTNGNVRYMAEDGEVLGTLCAHPDAYTANGDRVPDTDLHAGQVLALRSDEQGWLNRANLHYGVFPVHFVREPREREWGAA